METIENLKAEIDALRRENAEMKKTIDARNEEMEVARTQIVGLERTIQFLKGQIEAYQYCLNCRL